MKKIAAIFALLSTLILQAQISSTGTQVQANRWTIGGYAGVGGAFGNGNGGTSIYVTPRVGYQLTNDFEMGFAGNFTWNNSTYYSSTMLGIGPFANYYFGRSFYMSALYQHYFINQKNKSTQFKYSGDEDALYLGAGYMQKVGTRVYMQIGAMYNVFYDKDKSVFGGGFVPNIGFVYGL